MGHPTGEEISAAREDLSKDAKFWYGSSDVVRDALAAWTQLGLSGFELGKFAVDRGMLTAYNEILQYVEARLTEGVAATERMGEALDAALLEYDRTDQAAAEGITKSGHGK